VDVRTPTGMASLADVYTASTIVPPDVGSVSWRGRIELKDFSRPELTDVQLEPETGRLRVRVRSTAGVAAVHGRGPSGLEVLQRVEGDEHDGVWATDGFSFASELVARDRVFNDARQFVSGSQSFG
jgi:hypothetical protein